MIAQLQNYEYKAKRYEDVSAQLGEIILEANQRAAETVTQAQVQAEQIKKNAMTASQKITAEMSLMRNEISTVRTQLEDLMKTFTMRLDEIDHMLLEVVPAGADDVIAEVAQAARDEQDTAEPETPETPVKPCDKARIREEKILNQSFFRGAATI
ncbi:hypothetical protein SDC9_199637 [bioreactor metagenome]|uniref:Cell division protein DivIVA n=1 Tax=bioreactor metagenome TaxID=1076179 RepID=A0A645IKZ3_9ZZZZ